MLDMTKNGIECKKINYIAENIATIKFNAEYFDNFDECMEFLKENFFEIQTTKLILFQNTDDGFVFRFKEFDTEASSYTTVKFDFIKGVEITFVKY